MEEKMKVVGKTCFAVLIAVLVVTPFMISSVNASENAGNTKAYKVGDKVEPFTLKSTDDKEHNLADYLGKKIVVLDFWNCNCPVSRNFESQRIALINQFKEEDVVWFAIDSNEPNTVEEIKKYAEQQKLNYTILRDPGNKIADKFGAQRTPEIFVIGKDQKIQYHGAISDNQDEKQVKETYLSDALHALLDGKEVKTKTTNAVGCTIKRAGS